jgi:GTP-binding protein HflX
VQRRLNNEKSSLEELRDLAEAAGYTVVSQVTQIRRADPRYQIGAGKVAEIKNLIKETNAEKLLFDNRLKPRQSYNLAKKTGIEAIDRFKLILEIFTKNAKTKEAKLQIQLATLEYERTHAKERVRLAKISEQPGFMGLGAYQVDVYNEAINRQINTIIKKLKKIREKRALHRVRRSELGFQSVSLAGYTSAGKSSLFNSLTDETTQVDESLFTTLSTTTRVLEISKRQVLLTDTVGFIDRLPLRLIEAFHSTLEETIYSDLVILVLDISEPLDVIIRKFNICIDTIEQIGASQIPVIITLNKIDIISKFELKQKLEQLRSKMKDPILISALHKTNLDFLKQEIINQLEKHVLISFLIPLTEETMNFVSWIHEKSVIEEILYTDLGVKARLKINPLLAKILKNKVHDLNGKFEEIAQI